MQRCLLLVSSILSVFPFSVAAQNNKRAISVFFSLLFSFLISINTMPKKKKKKIHQESPPLSLSRFSP